LEVRDPEADPWIVLLPCLLTFVFGSACRPQSTYKFHGRCSRSRTDKPAQGADRRRPLLSSISPLRQMPMVVYRVNHRANRLCARRSAAPGGHTPAVLRRCRSAARALTRREFCCDSGRGLTDGFRPDEERGVVSDAAVSRHGSARCRDRDIVAHSQRASIGLRPCSMMAGGTRLANRDGRLEVGGKHTPLRETISAAQAMASCAARGRANGCHADRENMISRPPITVIVAAKCHQWQTPTRARAFAGAVDICALTAGCG